MSPDLRERKTDEPPREALRQRSVKEDHWFSEGSLPDKISTWFIEKNSFDKVSFMLAGCIFLVGIFLAFAVWFLNFNVQGAILITIALMSAAFTLLSVRESKRDREASVAPTLFVGKQEGEYGILNLGRGPAHELTVKVTTAKSDNLEVENKILCVDDFLRIGEEGEPKRVRMTYRSNVGYKQYDVTREVLLNDED